MYYFDRAEVSGVYSNEHFFFMDVSCLKLNNNRFKTRPTFLNAISCSKTQN